MKYLSLIFLSILFLPGVAQAVNLPTLSLGVKDAATPEEVSTALQVLFVLTILSIAPAILLMTTAFTRIVIVLGFVRQAMGTQNMPPNQIIIGLALFLTFFVMSPVFNRINTTALQPYMEEEISQQDALDNAVDAMRDFMFSQVQENELQLLIDITREEQPADKKDISTTILIPAFMLSELKLAFQMGFMIYVPFLVIDMLVASVLMSMGMMMLPPIIISLPFKLLLFVLVDGWHLVVGSLMQSFGGSHFHETENLNPNPRPYIMSPETVVHIGRKAVETVLLGAGPMLIAAMVVGLIISIFQAATQINEQTMTFIPKIVAVFVTLLIFGPWLMNLLITFTTGILTSIATVGQ